MDSAETFKVGDRVFAKIQGYPHWPAQITEVRDGGGSEEFCVAFYGTHEIAYVKQGMICQYNEETVEKYTANSSKKKQRRNSVLTFQRAMEECAAGITFLPCDIDNDPETSKDTADLSRSISSDDDALVIDEGGSSNKSNLKTQDSAIPKRGRPSKVEVIENLKAGKKGLKVAGSQHSEPPVVSDGVLVPMDIPLVPMPEADLMEKDPLSVDPLKSEAPAVEQGVKVATQNGVILQNGKDSALDGDSNGFSVTSRSGRKIKPKKFADEDVVKSPLSDHLVSASRFPHSSPPKKRKASVDTATETSRKVLIQNGVNGHPVSVPKKPQKSVSLDDKDKITSKDNGESKSGGVTAGAKRRSSAHRFTPAPPPPVPESIIWKVEAMKPLQDKLISSCKRIENLHLEGKGSHTLINTPVRNKLAEASSGHATIAAVTSVQVPPISKSMDAIAKIVAGDTSRKSSKPSSVSNSLRVSVGTSTAELQGSSTEAAATQSETSNVEPQTAVESSKGEAVQVQSDQQTKAPVEQMQPTVTKEVKEENNTVKTEPPHPTADITESAVRSSNGEEEVKIQKDLPENDPKEIAKVPDTTKETQVLPKKVSGKNKKSGAKKLPDNPAPVDPVTPNDQPAQENTSASQGIPEPEKNLTSSTETESSINMSDMPEKQATTETESKEQIQNKVSDMDAAETPRHGRKKVCFIESDDPSKESEGGSRNLPESGASKSNTEGKKSPGGILRKPSIEVKTEEGTFARRSHLQRKVEAPSRYKDSVPLMTTPRADIGKSRAGGTKKAESPKGKRLRSTESEDEIVKTEGNGATKRSRKGSMSNENGANMSSSDSEVDDFQFKITESDFDDEESKEKFRLKINEKAVMDAVVTLIDSAGQEHHDLDQALEMLKKLGEPGFIDRNMLKAHPEIVQVVRKMQYFMGNLKAVKLTKGEKAEFPAKTEKIREQAKKTLEGFKETMSTNTKPYAVLMLEEMQRKSSEGSESSPPC